MLFSKPKTMQYLIIEGNIGAGKSTFLKFIAEKLDIQPVFEPHQKWQNVNGAGNLLEKFYADAKRWAYTFQTYAFITRVIEADRLARSCSNYAQVVERSVYSDRYCFAKNAFELGLMTDLEWQLYQEWFAWLVDTYAVKPDCFIYLRTDPETCYARMQKRARSEEKLVSLDYLKIVHEKHEQWLLEKKGVAPYLIETPVLVLDCNKDFESNVDEQERHVQQIRDFFKFPLFVHEQKIDTRTL